VRTLFGITIIVLLVCVLATQTTPTDIMDANVASETSLSGSGDRVLITSNSDFAFRASIRGWPGNGTSGNPYLLNDLIIHSSPAIDISNTNVHFIIQDGELGGITGYYGVRLRNVANGTIKNCELNGQYGLDLEDSEAITIQKAVCNGAFSISGSSRFAITGSSIWYRLIIQNSYSFDIIDNVIGEAIIADCGSCTIQNNKVITDAILGGCGSCSILDNNVLDETILYECEGCNVQNNALHSGLTTYSGHHVVTGNKANGLPIAYFQDISGTEIDCSGLAQVILAYCTGVAIRNAHIIGIGVGISLGSSTGCSVTSSELEQCKTGVAVVSSTGCLVDGDSFQGCEQGVSIKDSTGCNVSRANITGSSIGIEVQESSDGLIESNSIIESTIGIQSTSSVDFDIIGNYVCGCFTTSIDLANCSDCVIYENELGWNGPPNAIDSSGSNLWDNGLDAGNSWSDYDGYGIYVVSGDSGSVDRYPSFLNDSLAPTIISMVQEPSEIWYGDDVTVNVSAIDDHGISQVIIHLSMDDSETWEDYALERFDQVWSISIDAAGMTFNYQIRTCDWAGNWKTSEVIKNIVHRVQAPTTSTTTTTQRTTSLDFQVPIDVVALALIAVVVVIVLARKR
jgi:parallel beta-helix repeat protein